jgi:hypothetical protein
MAPPSPAPATVAEAPPSIATEVPEARVNPGRTLRLALLCGLGALPALLDPAALQRAGALWPLAEGPSPYWLPAHGVLLYLWAPLVALSACWLLLAPGLPLAAALGGATGPGRWILLALGVDLLVLSAASALAEAVLPGAWTGRAFGALAAGLTAMGLVLLAARARAGARLP